MFTSIWNNVFYKPLLNALAFLVSVVPGADIGLAVVILTVLVKVVLFPLSKKSIESQAKMKLLEPELKKIKDSGLSKEEQAKKTMELYKTSKTNPFSGCLLILIQLPILFALYRVFLSGSGFNLDFLYPFVKLPETISMTFLGLDLQNKVVLVILAVITGITQFFQFYYMPKNQMSSGEKGSFQDNLAKSMNMNMKYIMPVFIAFIAYSTNGAIALYLITSNIFVTLQQIAFNNKEEKNIVIKK
jgi:YidC/Oxa1 family membrane protein insertase